jgi:glycosyltransferase involved in cell wall biosynthesis
MSEYFVSVCCQAYNHKDYISKCLDGFIMQKTNFKFEVLVHDDASTDGTAEILKQYESQYPNLFRNVYQTENQFNKQNTLTNILFKMAKGKYIALCEGDDYWTDPYKLQKQVDFLEANEEYSGSYHDTQVIYEGNDKIQPHLFRKILPAIITAEDTISNLSSFHTTSFVFRKSMLLLPEFINNVVSGDMALFSIIAASGNLGKVDGTMSVYRKHNDGITASASVTSNYHEKRIQLMHHLDKFHKYKYHQKVKKVISYHKSEIKKNKKAIGGLGLIKDIFNKVYGKFTR